MSRVSRREFAAVSLLSTAACGPSPEAKTPRETKGWSAAADRALLDKFLAVNDLRYDEREHMITAVLGPEYRYHTKIRNYRAHATRESVDYALYLLETQEPARVERAKATLDRVLSLQDADPKSEWFGLWGWYLEEPANKMAPADYNWADFIGGSLLVIEFRHGSELGGELRNRVREAIRMACACIRKRNVSMHYTNIAIKGTFVTQAAGELLNDAELLAYAKDRMIRLEQAVDESASFDEYNSPTYAQVSITDLTKIRMFAKDAEARHRAGQLEQRVWQHLASRWDVPRKQFAGPMSRCYATDLGRPAWLEKSLRGELGLVRPLAKDGTIGEGSGETAVYDYRCPENLRARFLTVQPEQEVREMFQTDKPGVVPVQGTTWLTPGFSLGSVNRGELWVQRRPILAYWGDDRRPTRAMTVRVVKDGYDFASAQLYSVQAHEYLLGVITFRNPGGDKHVSLDPVKDGKFTAGRLFAEIHFDGIGPKANSRLDHQTFTLAAQGIGAWIRILGGSFGKTTPRVSTTRLSDGVTLFADWLPEGKGPVDVRWSESSNAWLAFAMRLDGQGSAAVPADEPRLVVQAGACNVTWKTPAGALGLQSATRVGTIDALNAAYAQTLNGKPVPIVRLAGDKLA